MSKRHFALGPTEFASNAVFPLGRTYLAFWHRIVYRLGNHQTSLTMGLLFLLALLPRLFGLDAFLNIDEYTWLDRSRLFLLALRHSDWGGTYLTGHPGVTTMWSGALGLWLYGLFNGLVQNGSFENFLRLLDWNTQQMAIYPYVRLPIILVVCGTIALSYPLLTRLFNRRTALFAAILLAFDPWYLANSRALHHDALMATWMYLSALTLLLYTHYRPAAHWLLLSGICAGLALLSKTLSLFLLPWTMVVFAITWWQRRYLFERLSLPQLLMDGAIWTLSAVGTFFVAWPAMWQEPLSVLQRMLGLFITYSENPHQKGQFFLGEAVANPGPLFYPLVAIFALTPAMIVGTLWLVRSDFLSHWLSRMEQRPAARQGSGVLPFLFLYAVAFAVALTIGVKKQDRYLLPSLLIINLIAAVGLARLEISDFGVRTARWGHFSLNLHQLGRWLVVGLFSIQLWIAFSYFPYYGSYANPLAGGPQFKARLLLVGNEGNELAAEYLNGKNGSQSLRVVASQAARFAPFFTGQTFRWSPLTQVLSADYAVLNADDIVRGEPDHTYLNYITRSWPLERVITIHGVPYVYIYRGPKADWVQFQPEHNDAERYLGLLGYKLSQKAATPGERITVTIYIRPEEWRGRWVVQLRTVDGKLLYTGHVSDFSTSEDAALQEGKHEITIESQWLPGTYRLALGRQATPSSPIHWLPPDTFPAFAIIPPIEKH